MVKQFDKSLGKNAISRIKSTARIRTSSNSSETRSNIIHLHKKKKKFNR